MCFPTTLQQWDKRYPKSCTPSSLKPGGSLDSQSDTLSFAPIDTIAIINLARRFDLDDILPATFYICSMLPLEDIVAQVRYGDSGGATDTEELSRDDLFRCLRGIPYYLNLANLGSRRIRAIDSMAEYDYNLCSAALFEQSTPNCEHRSTPYPTRCNGIWHEIMQEFRENEMSRTRDILCSTSHWVREQNTEGDVLCDGCLKGVIQLGQSWRMSRWEGLPEMFNLSSIKNSGAPSCYLHTTLAPYSSRSRAMRTECPRLMTW